MPLRPLSGLSRPSSARRGTTECLGLAAPSVPPRSRRWDARPAWRRRGHPSDLPRPSSAGPPWHDGECFRSFLHRLAPTIPRHAGGDGACYRLFAPSTPGLTREGRYRACPGHCLARRGRGGVFPGLPALSALAAFPLERGTPGLARKRTGGRAVRAGGTARPCRRLTVPAGFMPGAERNGSVRGQRTALHSSTRAGRRGEGDGCGCELNRWIGNRPLGNRWIGESAGWGNSGGGAFAAWRCGAVGNPHRGVPPGPGGPPRGPGRRRRGAVRRGPAAPAGSAGPWSRGW